MDEKLAYVLITCRPGFIFSVREHLSKQEWVKAVHAVTGPHDVIAFVSAVDADALASLVVTDIQSVEGVSRTLTCFVISARHSK